MLMRSLLIAVLVLAASAAATFGQGKITGRVAYADGRPLHGVEVTVVQRPISTRTDDDGRYELSGVPAGSQTIRYHLDGFSDVTRTVEMAAADVVVDVVLNVVSLREDVTVTASGSEQAISDAMQSVTSVGTLQLLQRASASIGDVLAGETGVAKRSFGPGSSRPVIRGFDGDRVLILQDGVRSGSVGSQSGDHGEPIDPMAAERIEVVKGPGTLLYGSNALGGVVNVISNDEKNPHDGWSGSFTGVAGTADRLGSFSAGAEYGFKKFRFRGNGGASRTGDLSTPIGRVPNSSSRSHNGAFSTGYYGRQFYITGGYAGDIRRYGIPYAALFEAEKSFERPASEILPPTPEEEIDVRMRNHKFTVSGGLRELTNPFLSGLQFSLDRTSYRHKEIEGVDGIDEVGTIFSNRSLSYRTLFEQKKFESLTGRFGFEGFARRYQVEGAEQLINGPIRHDSFSLFGLEELDLGRVRFQFGGRFENNRYRPENTDLRPRSFSAFSGGAGVNVGLWKGGSFVANYTFSNRAPALEELYNHGPHIGTITYEIGNPDLRRETSNGLDLSLRHRTGRFGFSADTYYYRINNFVFLAYQDADGDGVVDVEDGLPVGRYTQDNAEYFGIELSADASFTDYLGGSITVDHVRARLTGPGLDLPRIPPTRVRAGLDIKYKALTVRPEIEAASAQNKVYPLERPTKGYALFNLGGSYMIATQHQAHIFSVMGYNLTDTLYRNHVSFIKDLVPEIGRGVRFGYTLRFF